MENLQGAGTVTSALHYRIRSCQILVTGKQQKRMGAKTRARSGSGQQRAGSTALPSPRQADNFFFLLYAHVELAPKTPK
jgi:hypothetical protein